MRLDDGRPTGAGPNGTTTPQYGALEVNPEILKRFKDRVDSLLNQLKGSKVDPRTLSQHAIPPAAFGQGFAEAQALSGTYAAVLSQLEEFSRIFGEQIETLSIGTDFVGRSYEHVDDDVKNRMAAIQRRTQGFYKAPQQPSQAPQPTNQPSDSASTTPARGDGQTAAPDGI